MKQVIFGVLLIPLLLLPTSWQESGTQTGVYIPAQPSQDMLASGEDLFHSPNGPGAENNLALPANRSPESGPSTNWSASSTTATLQQGVEGYTGCQDTHIYQFDPDNAVDYRWKAQLKVGYKQQNAALLRFDLSAIPANATVTHATLHLYAEGWSGSDATLYAYSIARNTNIHHATWNHAQPGIPWAVPGCNDPSSDRRPLPEGSFTTTGIRKWYALDLSDVVPQWVTQRFANNGILLQAAHDNSSIYFSSAQSSATSLRPKLIITYRSGNEPGPERTSTPTRTPTAVATLSRTPTASSHRTNTPRPTHTSQHTPTPSSDGAVTTIILQQGVSEYTGCQDTHIYQFDPDNAVDYRRKAQLKVGYKQQNAALLRFDLSAIPANATVTHATLHLYAEGWSGSDATLYAYSIVRNTNIHHATWNHAQPGIPWAVPGCNDPSSDRRPLPEGSFTSSGIRKWYALDLSDVAPQWVTQRFANNGILLQAAHDNSSIYFSSAQSSATSLRPKLIITYRSGNEPGPERTSVPTRTPASPPTPGKTPTPAPTAPPHGNAIIVGHITDAHIGGSWVYSQRLPYVVKTLSQKAHVLVDTGDCTEHGNGNESAEYADIIAGAAAVPWRAVPGNHDTPEVFERYIGPTEWSWDVGAYRLIGINTESISYAALDSALTHGKTCIVFGHFPLSWCTPEDQARLRQRFQTYGVPIYIAGHTHLDSTQVDTQSGTLLLTGQRAGLGHYRLITLRGTEIVDIAFENAWN